MEEEKEKKTVSGTPIAKNKMLELTNKNKLPDIIYKALQFDSYVGGGDISVTTLIDAPRVRILKKRHKPINDASDFLFSMMGTALHTILEFAEYEQHEVSTLIKAQDILTRHGANKVSEWLDKWMSEEFKDYIDNNIIQEKRLTIEVDGWSLSGKFDRFDVKKKLLTDFKMTSAYSWIHKDLHVKYRDQLSIYAYMLRKNGFDVDAAEIIFIFRDWSRNNMIRNKDYPSKIVEQLNIPLMTDEETEIFITKRIAIHKQAEIGILPECTDKEMWSTNDQYKIYKKVKGAIAKRCINGGTHVSYESAIAHKSKVQPGEINELVIKHFPSKRTRCESYCSVKDYCEQYKDYINNKNRETII